MSKKSEGYVKSPLKTVEIDEEERGAFYFVILPSSLYQYCCCRHSTCFQTTQSEKKMVEMGTDLKIKKKIDAKLRSLKSKNSR